jgi:hypothetical protein
MNDTPVNLGEPFFKDPSTWQESSCFCLAYEETAKNMPLTAINNFAGYGPASEYKRQGLRLENGNVSRGWIKPPTVQ